MNSSKYIELKEELDNLVENQLFALSVEDSAYKDLDKLLKEEEILGCNPSKDQIAISCESMNELSLKYLGESISSVVSVEELTGTRVNMVKRFLKRITNLGSSFLDISEKISAIGGLMHEYEDSVLRDLKKDLESGKIVPTGEKTKGLDISNINRKLAIYYETHNKFDVKKLTEFLNTPYKLIVEDKLFEEVTNYAHDQLIVGRFTLIDEDQEDVIPVCKPSVDFLDKIKSKTIRKWLNKDTKAGIIDRIIGSRFSVVSVYQDARGADARHDYFSVSKGEYTFQDIPPLSKKELLELIDFGIEAGKNFHIVAAASTSGFWSTTFTQIRSTMMTVIYTTVGGIFSLRRKWRAVFMAGEFFKGIRLAMLMQNKSYKDIPLLIKQIVDAQTKKA